jgi:hypothetical protein
LLNSGRLSFSRTNFIGYPGINRDLDSIPIST